MPINTAEVVIPDQKDILVSSRNFVLASSCALNLAAGTNVPEWLNNAMLLEIARGTTSMQELINNLANLFAQLETGITHQVNAIQTDTLSLYSTLDAHVARLDDDMAGALQLVSTKVTPEYAEALMLDALTAQFNTPNSTANAWFVNLNSVYADATSANAISLQSLSATFNGLSAALETTGYVTVGEDIWEVGASKLAISPTGAITGWSFTDGSALVSNFTIAADNFYIESSSNPDYKPFKIENGQIVFNGSVNINSDTSPLHIGAFPSPPSSPVLLGTINYTIKDGDTYTNTTDSTVYYWYGTGWISTAGSDGSRGAVSVFKSFAGPPSSTDLTNAIYAVVEPNILKDGDHVVYTTPGLTGGTLAAYYQNGSWTSNVQLYVNGSAVIEDTLSASTLKAHTIWTDGKIESYNYVHPAYTGDTPTGFAMAANSSDLGGWNIVGGRIYGGDIYGANITAGSISADTITSGDLTTCQRGTNSLYVSNSNGTGILFTYSMYTTVRYIFQLRKDGVVVDTFNPSEFPGGFQYLFSSLQPAGTGTYTVTVSTGAVLGGGKFGAVSLKK